MEVSDYLLTDGTVWSREDINKIVESLYQILSENKLSTEKSEIILDELKTILPCRNVLL